MNLKPLLALAVATLLTGCAGSPGPTPTVTVTETVTASPEVEQVEGDPPAEEKSTSDVASLGEAAENFGVELVVEKASITNSIPMNRSGYRSGSGSETYTDAKPDSGGKYLVVQTTFNNIGKVSKDLTCGYALAIQAVDTEDRVFDPIDNLYEYKGNPECNAQLQPGFEEEMTYVFLVPKDAALIGVVFNDPENEDYDDYTAIRFKQNLR